MLLLELFDKPYPLDVQTNTDYQIEAFFKDDDNEPYYISAMLIGDFNDVDGNPFDFWTTSFQSKDASGQWTYDLQHNRKHASRVFATTIDIMNMVKAKGGHAILLTGDHREPARVKIYTRMSPVFAKALRWKVFQYSDTAHGEEGFVLYHPTVHIDEALMLRVSTHMK